MDISTKISMVPFAEPPWLTGSTSAYYGPTHVKWQRTCREFITEKLLQNAFEWDTAGFVPEHVYEEFARSKFLIAALPAPLPVELLKSQGIDYLPGNLKIEEFDYMHNVIFGDEMTRSGLLGPPSAITTGISFGLPPIYKFGSKWLQDHIIPDVLCGKKRICIAITEPDAGSDVAGIQTRAKLSDCGEYFIVNGAKKWITNGIWCDYATMAVRTECKNSMEDLSLIVVPLKGHTGVSMRRISVQGQKCAGTTFIELDNVHVPSRYIIGQRGHGMKYIMMNFNHERLSIAVSASRQARVALSSAFSYVLKREAFGKSLIQQPVVRNRLARAGALLESQWAWIEQFAYQMCHISRTVDDGDDIRMVNQGALGGLIALAKANGGIVLKECAECAILLFGGNGYTCSGVGEIAERIWREVPGVRIPGGSEDVMLDLSIRQLVKCYTRQSQALQRQSNM